MKRKNHEIVSAYFSPRALRALNRLGDILVPGDDDLPSFSQYGGLQYIDRIVAYAPLDDIEALNKALGALQSMPDFALRTLVRRMSAAADSESRLGTPLRMLNLGIRGLVFSCYYAGRPGDDYRGQDPADAIGFSIHRVED